MKPVELKLPVGSIVYNSLYPSSNVDLLTQDLLTVRLPTGMCIDVGWYPEHSPNGRYLLRTFDRTWDNQRTQSEYDDLAELIQAVEGLAAQLARTNAFVSSSDSGSFRVSR